jgi:7-cyano-7-deazaguanine synthase
MHVVTILSGGLDSTVLAHHLASLGYEQTFVTFDYQQRHFKEMYFAQLTAQRLNGEHVPVSLGPLVRFWQGSALVGDHAVPHGHYEAPSMAITVVPNRNLIFLTIAAAVAVSRGATAVFTGVHSGDHAIYQDCRPEFIHAADAAMQLSCGVSVNAPFVHFTKANIVRTGTNLAVPFEETWSCYEGGARHCGQCGTCVERIEAFKLAGVEDPTQYA